ncbi:amidohydrolase family protein [Ekhidna sp.]|uniref:metal-dependent hydrolase family protein n=3 Tax=Ekhidna sp. TaxID=2608089 RepID=UPI0032998D90
MRQIITLLLCLWFSVGFAQRTKLTADRLFDGEEMKMNWGVVVEENRIVEVGPISQLGNADVELNYDGGTLMPGMIEGHSHVLLYPYNQMEWNDQVLKESRSLRAIRGAKMATKNLYAGFTTIRDLGSEGAGYADVAIKQSIEQGIIEGPRMLVAGRAIVATGSYGPKGFHPDFEVPLGAEPADGENLITVTRDQIGKGADFIKVYADYRWGPNKTAMPTFSVDELKLIVETAASSGRVVVAHAATAEGMRRATLAGVKTIEHGSEATDEVLQLMKERGVALCPTLAATHAVNQYLYGWDGKDPEPERIKSKRSMFQRALNSGVTIVAGGDVGVFEHGENVRELELMVEYGMKRMDVLKSVTSVNAEVFGLQSLGRLQEGFLADIIVVAGDPSKNIADLYQVKLVMKDGTIYKQ